jgi:hypothetical protein
VWRSVAAEGGAARDAGFGACVGVRAASSRFVVSRAATPAGLIDSRRGGGNHARGGDDAAYDVHRTCFDCDGPDATCTFGRECAENFTLPFWCARLHHLSRGFEGAERRLTAAGASAMDSSARRVLCKAQRTCGRATRVHHPCHTRGVVAVSVGIQLSVEELSLCVRIETRSLYNTQLPQAPRGGWSFTVANVYCWFWSRNSAQSGRSVHSTMACASFHACLFFSPPGIRVCRIELHVLSAERAGEGYAPIVCVQCRALNACGGAATQVWLRRHRNGAVRPGRSLVTCGTQRARAHAAAPQVRACPPRSHSPIISA